MDFVNMECEVEGVEKKREISCFEEMKTAIKTI